MPQTLTIEVPDAFVEAWRKLQPAQQSAVVDFTSRLAAEEEVRLSEEDESGWDQRFSDPEKSARFLEWGRQALAGPGDEPLDLKRL